MRNKEVAQLLSKIAALLSLEEGNFFRVRAYEKAVQAIEAFPSPVEEAAEKDELAEIPGIGESIAEKIKEFLNTGKSKYLEELEKKFPEGLIEIMNVQSIGPKKALMLYKKLKIKNVEDLKKMASEGKLSSLPGFGKKTEENIIKGIELTEKSGQRMLLNEAVNLAESIIEQLKKTAEVEQISTAGSLRRGKETIGDIDILCTAKKGRERAVIDRFLKLPLVSRILSEGDTKGSIITGEGIQVDLRVVETSSYGAALQYFTGSKEHNVVLREYARKKGLTINEYGVFKLKGEKPAGKPVAGKTEEEVYNILGMQYMPPELRENRGEIEIAKAHKIPRLIELPDIKGDGHVHSNYSDGFHSIEEMALKGIELGYEWIIISDHSQSLHVARGLGIDKLNMKRKEIDELNKKVKSIRILFGTEVDILNDGRIDYPDEILKSFDFVIASVHTNFKQVEKEMTARIIKALENKYVHCLGHPTGRLLYKREPYHVNMEAVLNAAKENGEFIELNAFPDRLDLDDVNCRRAKEMGIKIAINTDSHNKSHMDFMKLGISVARRGWLEKSDVINTLSHEQLMKLLHRSP